MVNNKSISKKIFDVINYVFLIVAALMCIAPIVHVFMISLSSSSAVAGGGVGFWPVGFNLQSYRFVFDKPEFIRAMGISVQRVAFGSVINMVLLVITAYPLSKSSDSFQWRTFYVWFLYVPSLFGAGLIPTYLVVKMTGLIDSVWALILPGAVQIFNIVLLINFFRNIPKELEEATFLDGGGHWCVLRNVYLPLSKAALATIFLFAIVGHWNSYFDGMIYMNMPEKYPLQTYLRTLIAPDASGLTQNANDLELLLYGAVNDETAKAAQIFVGALPILLVYPFLQKHFTAGITLGSVKG